MEESRNFLEGIFNNLKGERRLYGSLSIDHKFIVYAYELWKAGLELEVAAELLCDTTLTESFIDGFLEKNHGYKEDTVIGESNNV